MGRWKRSVIVASLLLLGAGCTGPVVSEQTPEEAAASIVIDENTSFVIQPTVLGLGEQIAGWFGQRNGWIVDVESYAPNRSVFLQWETGKESEPTTGSLTLGGLESGETLLIPKLWQAGDTVHDDKTGIWLSHTQYDALKAGAKTQISLGLFDASLSSALQLKDDVSNALSALQQKDQNAHEGEDIVTVSSKGTGAYTLMVAGTQTTVATLEAENWFAHYTILDNPAHPVVLKLTINPVASAGIENLSWASVMRSLLGYAVTEINTSGSF